MTPDESNNATGPHPNHHVSATIAATHATCDESIDPKSELDSHANMVVLGRGCFVFEWSGKSCSVNPFTDTLGSVKDVPIVDAAIAYECPYTQITYVLICRNALYIPSMYDNLIPPFILRESGAMVNDIAKIHCPEPTNNDHCITFEDSDLKIPLHLNGTFSYFHTRKPTQDELQSCDKLFITPDKQHWNPYCTSYALNEHSMLNYEGEITEVERREHHLVDHDFDDADIASVTIEAHDNQVDATISSSFCAISSRKSNIPDDNFVTALNQRTEMSKMMASIGSVSVDDSPCELFSDPIFGQMEDLESAMHELLGDDVINVMKAKLSAVQATRSHGVKKDLLSKLWVVTEDEAQYAIDHSTQLCKHHADNGLSRQFSTNDRMLRYKRIQSVFFTDTLFALKKNQLDRILWPNCL